LFKLDIDADSGEEQMKRLARIIILLFILCGVLFYPQPAWAHQNVTVGDYTVEYGWINEPAVVGQPNAVVINITPKDAETGSNPDVDVSGLTITAVYGGQTKALVLQPLGEDTPGQFIAPMTPMRAGEYTIHLGGNVGSTAFNMDVTPEEVMTADVVQFPVLDATQDSGIPAIDLWGWLAIAGVVLGVTGILLGLAALLRKPARK
jgi:hypothetical protein